MGVVRIEGGAQEGEARRGRIGGGEDRGDHCSSLEGESMARALTFLGIYPKYIVNIEVTSQWFTGCYKVDCFKFQFVLMFIWFSRKFFKY